jgi:hypothetical protein
LFRTSSANTTSTLPRSNPTPRRAQKRDTGGHPDEHGKEAPK